MSVLPDNFWHQTPTFLFAFLPAVFRWSAAEPRPAPAGLRDRPGVLSGVLSGPFCLSLSLSVVVTALILHRRVFRAYLRPSPPTGEETRSHGGPARSPLPSSRSEAHACIHQCRRKRSPVLCYRRAWPLSGEQFRGGRLRIVTPPHRGQSLMFPRGWLQAFLTQHSLRGGGVSSAVTTGGRKTGPLTATAEGTRRPGHPGAEGEAHSPSSFQQRL